MSETALKARGIEDARTGTLLVAAIGRPGAGRVDLVVRNGIQPLGPAEGLHTLKGLVRALVQSFPALPETIATVVATEIAHAKPPATEPRP